MRNRDWSGLLQRLLYILEVLFFRNKQYIAVPKNIQVTETPTLQTPETIRSMKPGVKTTEFWLSLAAIFVPQLAPVVGIATTMLDPGTAAVVGGVVASSYSIARAWVKAKKGVELPQADFTPAGRA